EGDALGGLALLVVLLGVAFLLVVLLGGGVLVGGGRHQHHGRPDRLGAAGVGPPAHQGYPRRPQGRAEGQAPPAPTDGAPPTVGCNCSHGNALLWNANRNWPPIAARRALCPGDCRHPRTATHRQWYPRLSLLSVESYPLLEPASTGGKIRS